MGQIDLFKNSNSIGPHAKNTTSILKKMYIWTHNECDSLISNHKITGWHAIKINKSFK